MNDIIICKLDGKKVLIKHLAKHLKLYHQKNYKECQLKEEIASKRGIKVIRLWESDIKKDPSIIIRTLTPHIY